MCHVFAAHRVPSHPSPQILQRPWNHPTPSFPFLRLGFAHLCNNSEFLYGRPATQNRLFASGSGSSRHEFSAQAQTSNADDATRAHAHERCHFTFYTHLPPDTYLTHPPSSPTHPPRLPRGSGDQRSGFKGSGSGTRCVACALGGAAAAAAAASPAAGWWVAVGM